MARAKEHLREASLRATRRWPAYLAWLATGLAFAVDSFFKRADPPLALAALMDETAHASSALLLLGTLRRRCAPAVSACTVLGAVLIDTDHLPMQLGSAVLTRGTNRPYTHSLLAISGVVLIAALLPGIWRGLALSAAFGVATHLVRDMATGGVPLYWPLTGYRVTIPYAAYALLLLIAAGVVMWRDRSGAGPAVPRRAVTPGERG